jgi:hypothetical protein
VRLALDDRLPLRDADIASLSTGPDSPGRASAITEALRIGSFLLTPSSSSPGFSASGSFGVFGPTGPTGPGPFGPTTTGGFFGFLPLGSKSAFALVAKASIATSAASDRIFIGVRKYATPPKTPDERKN